MGLSPLLPLPSSWAFTAASVSFAGRRGIESEAPLSLSLAVQSYEWKGGPFPGLLGEREKGKMPGWPVAECRKGKGKKEVIDG